MWLWILAAAAAFYIKGLCGFANTLVFTTILGFGASNVNISPVELVLGYPANIMLAWKNRKSLSAKVYIPLSLLVLAGNIPGAFLLKNADARFIKIIFGVVVVLLGAEMLYREKRRKPARESKAVLGIIGVISGVLCGLFGVGALLAAYVGRVTDTGDEFKANICAVFIVENTFRIILYSFLGIITAASLKQSLAMMPFVFAGLFAGMKSSRVLNDKTVKKLVVVFLIISGFALILKNI
ncbi:MAG: sulfite exporter TauE/SafE family protein [Pyramidobacter sp.]|jgi:uncharacterized membrane protein YfcA